MPRVLATRPRRCGFVKVAVAIATDCVERRRNVAARVRRLGVGCATVTAMCSTASRETGITAVNGGVVAGTRTASCRVAEVVGADRATDSNVRSRYVDVAGLDGPCDDQGAREGDGSFAKRRIAGEAAAALDGQVCACDGRSDDLHSGHDASRGQSPAVTREVGQGAWQCDKNRDCNCSHQRHKPRNGHVPNGTATTPSSSTVFVQKAFFPASEGFSGKICSPRVGACTPSWAVCQLCCCVRRPTCLYWTRPSSHHAQFGFLFFQSIIGSMQQRLQLLLQRCHGVYNNQLADCSCVSFRMQPLLQETQRRLCHVMRVCTQYVLKG